MIFANAHIDEFVFQNLGEYNKRKIVNIEMGDGAPLFLCLCVYHRIVDAVTKSEEKPSAEDSAKSAELIKFLSEALADRVSSVKATSRLVSSPAIIVDHEVGLCCFNRWQASECCCACVCSRLRCAAWSSTLTKPLAAWSANSTNKRCCLAPLCAERTAHTQCLITAQLEINPNHPVMVGLLAVKNSKPDVAKIIAEQVNDSRFCLCC